MLLQRKLSLLVTFSIMFLFVLTACAASTGSSPTSNSSTVISVVAAENFYGNILQQLGGNHVSITSIISDPNVDPHQYESNVQNALAVSKANLVIENGEGYDSWMDKLLSASPNSSRVVLVATAIADHKLPDNPHVWYGIDNTETIAKAMTSALKKLDSADSTTFDQNLQTFLQSLMQIKQKMQEIKARYAGTPVGLTEDIYLYQAIPLSLNVLTPAGFQKAIAEGNDPSADTVVTANNQVNQHQIKILIYNEQTVTPITTNLQNAAKKQHIPIVAVTETMPKGKTYQQWMLDQLIMLEQSLQVA